MTGSASFPPGSTPPAGKSVHLAFDGGRLTSDTGVLMLADIERRLGIVERLARCIADPRAPERVQHTLAEMIRFRVLLIAAGYPDANDCDALRHDPAFKMAVGRAPESGEDLCSQPTMSRLENLPTALALKRMMAAMVELRAAFLAYDRAGEDVKVLLRPDEDALVRRLLMPGRLGAAIAVHIGEWVGASSARDPRGRTPLQGREADALGDLLLTDAGLVRMAEPVEVEDAA